MQLKRNQPIGRSILLGVGIGVGLAIVFFAGFIAREFVDAPTIRAATSPDASEGGSYPLLDEIQVLLDGHFLRTQSDYAARQYGAVRGMLATLNDRYTFFIDPPVAASESDVLAGTYGGIGVQISRTTEGDIALYPFVDSPAERAGIQNGDILKALNGSPLDPLLSQDSIDQMMRGEVKQDSGVELGVVHPDGTELTVFIAFDVINVPSVTWRVLSEDESLGYVHILRFTDRTPEELQEGLAELKTSGVEGIVLDLRDNTGGLLRESIDVADEFLDSGVIVYQVEPTGETEYRAEPGGALIDLPMVLLVNDHTASGAELVAGAIRDQDRGILIGRRTYGKGTVQQIFPLSDGSSLHVTSAEWFTPARRALDAVGIEPDVVVEIDPEGRDLDLSAAIQYLHEHLLESTES